MDNDVITQYTNRTATLDLTVKDIASGDCADLGDLISLANLGIGRL